MDHTPTGLLGNFCNQHAWPGSQDALRIPFTQAYRQLDTLPPYYY